MGQYLYFGCISSQDTMLFKLLKICTDVGKSKTLSEFFLGFFQAAGWSFQLANCLGLRNWLSTMSLINASTNSQLETLHWEVKFIFWCVELTRRTTNHLVSAFWSTVVLHFSLVYQEQKSSWEKGCTLNSDLTVMVVQQSWLQRISVLFRLHRVQCKERSPTGHWHPWLKESNRQDLGWWLKWSEKRCYLPGLTWYECASRTLRGNLRSPQALHNTNGGIAVSFLCVELLPLLPNQSSRDGCVH